MKQRRNDDGAFSTGSRIRMTALCPGDDTVGADNNVDIEFRINFEGTEDDKVQFIDVSALVEGVSIMARRDFIMVRVRLDVFNGSRIKILRISNLVDEAFMLQIG